MSTKKANIVNTGTGQYTITTTNTAGFLDTPLTETEQKELDNLESERKIWKKQQELLYFKSLSPELRQDVVNEALVRKMMKDIHDVDESKFEGYTRLEELRYKNNNHIRFTIQDGSSFSLQSAWRYQALLDRFTTDELVEAHAAATLEEALGD